MKVFLTGATGYIGSVVAEALQAAGHSVLGLARSDEAAGELQERGIEVVRGDLSTPESFRDAAGSSDAAIQLGTTNDGNVDAAAVRVLLDAMHGAQKTFIYTSGTWVLGNTGPNAAEESAPLDPSPIVSWRPAVEKLVLNAAGSGQRTVVIRPAMVYGRADGLPAMFVDAARKNGVAQYIGDGENRWTFVDVDDLADLYLRVLEHAAPGTLWHAADGEPCRLRDLAEAASFAADAGGKAESITLEQARQTMGPLADAFALDQNVSARQAKEKLGWNPHAVSVLEDLRYGSYAMRSINP